MRMFERDKDELRALGVPIETVSLGDGDLVAYRLPAKKFYLPYLQVASMRGRAVPQKRVGHFGYHSLQSLAFEPDELEVIADAAARIRALDDPVLSAEVDAAIRKLALDLPLDASLPRDAEGDRASSPVAVIGAGEVPTYRVRPRARASNEVFERLSDALARRKVATFDYHTIERDAHARRTVEPCGLFFLGTHWYLAARDRDRQELRNFRLSRISAVSVNPRTSQSPDYAIDTAFDLRAHARSREAWEIGDGDAVAAEVELVARTGATAAASELGKPVVGSSSRRAFEVRRMDTFARWLLSFGGDMRPLSPPDLVAEYQRQARATHALYAQGVDPLALGPRPQALPPAAAPLPPEAAP